MRLLLHNPWTLLTLRGRVMLVLGGAIAVLAALFGQRDVLMVGLLLFLLPLVSAVFVDRTSLRLSCERTVTPSRAAIGESMTGSLVIGRHGRLPSGVLRFEDLVPPELGERPRFTLQNLASEWSREITYPLTGTRRGRFATGPLLVRTSDPFGLAGRDRSFTATSEVMITPQVVPLESMRNAGGSGGTGEARPQRLGLSGHDDILVREYHRGDDVRRIHWRSTARHGNLMVRREEQAWDPSATVVLDTRARAHRGQGADGSFEWVVSMVASLTLHFLSDGFTISLFGADGPLVGPAIGDQARTTSRREALTQLTDVTETDSDTFALAVEAALSATTSQMLVAVLGDLSSADAAHLIEMQRNRAYALAWVLDVDGWDEERAPSSDPADRDRAVALLGDAGWRVVRVEAGTSVQEAWTRMGRLGELL